MEKEELERRIQQWIQGLEERSHADAVADLWSGSGGGNICTIHDEQCCEAWCTESVLVHAVEQDFGFNGMDA